jgi:hypothetical protein
MFLVALAFIIAASAIWLAPKPSRAVDMTRRATEFKERSIV